jgi:hypothetical protein
MSDFTDDLDLYYGFDGFDDPHEVQCTRCGRYGLYWLWAARWLLTTKTGRVHVCFDAASPREFEVVNAPVA